METTEKQFARDIFNLFDQLVCFNEVEADDLEMVQTFKDAGIITNNEGFVIRKNDGTSFQITIAKQ